MIRVVIIFNLILALNIARGQAELPPDEPTLSKIEIIAGPSLLYRLGKSSKGDESRQIAIGYSAGLGLVIYKKHRLEISSRLLWERKGFSTKDENINDNGDLRLAVTKDMLNYLTFSIVNSLSLDEKRRSKIMGGAYFSLLNRSTFSEEIYLNNQLILSSFFDTTNRGRFKSYDYGLSLGFSQKIISGNKTDLAFQLLSNWGIGNIVGDRFANIVIKPFSLNLSAILIHNRS